MEDGITVCLPEEKARVRECVGERGRERERERERKSRERERERTSRERELERDRERETGRVSIVSALVPPHIKHRSCLTDSVFEDV